MTEAKNSPKDFPVYWENLLDSFEDDTQMMLSTMKLRDREFDIFVSFDHSDTVGSKDLGIHICGITFSVVSHDATPSDDVLAEIVGHLYHDVQQDEWNVRVVAAINQTISDFGETEVIAGQEHIPKLVESTIAHLLGKGIVNHWKSSALLSTGGRKLYASLAKNENLSVREETVSGKIRFSITKRK